MSENTMEQQGLEMRDLMQSMLNEFREMKTVVRTLESKIASLEGENVRAMEIGGPSQAPSAQQEEAVRREEAVLAARKAMEDEDTLLLRMKKTCNVEPYRGSRAMGVLENWISRMNRYMRHFRSQVNDYSAGVFANGYLMDKALTWYDTWERSIVAEGGQVTWSGMQEGLLRNFQSVDSVQMARMKLWELKQRGSLSEYVEEFQDLQVAISDMSPAEALDAFKRGLKERIRQEVMVNNPRTVFDAIGCAQRIAGALGAARGGDLVIPPNNVYGGPTPMELGNLRQREGYARPFYNEDRREYAREPPGREAAPRREQPRREAAPRGGGARNYEPRGEQRRCYNCGRFGHLAAQCRTRVPRGNRVPYRRPLNHLNGGGEEEEEFDIPNPGNEERQ